MDSVIANDRKALQMANFENTTTQRIDRKLKQQMFETKRKEYEENLVSRRKKLADLYNYEINSWRQEILARVETQEDRKQRIMQRAYALRDARERERQEYVRKRYDEQWRDSCDDARTLDSKATVIFMNQERRRQIQEKVESKQELSRQENSFLEEWNRQLDELERRDKEKNDYRQRVNMETSAAIRKQIEDNMKAKEYYYTNLMAEEQAELDRLRREIDAEEAVQRRRTEEAHRLGRDVMRFNLENRKVRQEEAKVEAEQDAILLDYALRKEREQIAAEEAKRNANKQAALQYGKYLEEQMIKEAEDTAFVDEIRRREEEKVWKARDDALQAREDARNYLMKLVDEGRQDQIRYKHEHEARERAADSKFVTKFMQDAADAVRQEQEEVEARRRIAESNNEQLQKQIQARRLREEMEKQEAYLADKEMKYREKLHQQRLAQQAGTVRLNYPLQKNNWYT
jgi:hypothetical protein